MGCGGLGGLLGCLQKYMGWRIAYCGYRRLQLTAEKKIFLQVSSFSVNRPMLLYDA